jgi:signal transduction histidine kinase
MRAARIAGRSPAMALMSSEAATPPVQATCADVLDISKGQEQLIEALLTLARSQRGLDRREPLDLALITTAVIHGYDSDARARGIGLELSADPAPLAGDQHLIERLISNLLDNALRYNVPHGNVRVLVTTSSDWVTLTVTNSGPAVPAHQVPRLVQPFQRLTASRTTERDGLGVGLSIVAAIATAHSATLEIVPGVQGGLVVRARFPTRTDGQRLTRYQHLQQPGLRTSRDSEART